MPFLTMPSPLPTDPRLDVGSAAVWTRGAASAALLALLSGCQYEEIEGPTSVVIQWAPWIRFAAILVPVLGWAAALLMLRSSKRRGEGAVVLVVAALSTFVSMAVYQSRITITQDEVFDRPGFPWNRRWRGIRFDEVARVSVFEERRRNYRSSSVDSVWVLHLNSGEQQRLEPGDLWDAARETIDEHLSRAGIRLGVDPTTLGLPSDDPMVVTMPGGDTYRLDSDDAVESLSALFFGGYLTQMTARGGDETLRDRVDAGASVEATWSTAVANGRDPISFQLAIDGEGHYRFEVRTGLATKWCEGKARLTNVEFILEAGSSTFSTLRSDVGGAD